MKRYMSTKTPRVPPAILSALASFSILLAGCMGDSCDVIGESDAHVTLHYEPTVTPEELASVLEEDGWNVSHQNSTHAAYPDEVYVSASKRYEFANASEWEKKVSLWVPLGSTNWTSIYVTSELPVHSQEEAKARLEPVLQDLDATLGPLLGQRVDARYQGGPVC